MPVEVRELVIKATITPDENPVGGTSSSTVGSNGADPNEEMIKVCVEKVLQLIRDKNER